MSKNRMMKVLAVISTAIMAVTATGITAAASEIDTNETVSSVEASAEKKLVMGSVQGAAGETVEVPLTMFTGSSCMFYDICVEFDSRLEYVESDMAQACEFEENGQKFISLAGFGITPFADGETAATMSFKIPENANVNDSFEIKIAGVNNFASDEEAFENVSTSDAAVTVIQGAEVKKAEEIGDVQTNDSEAKATLSMESKTAVPGEAVDVPVVLYSDNQCTSYAFSVKYDSALELVDVSGAMLSTPYEENGEKYVALIGYKASPYKDGKAIATLKFAVPKDVEGEQNYEVSINNVESIQSDSDDFTGLTETVNSVIAVSGGKKNMNPYGNGCFGDVNGDGSADIRDAALIARCVAGRKLDNIDQQGHINGDVNEDGNLDIRDAAKIAKYVAKGRVNWNF